MTGPDNATTEATPEYLLVRFPDYFEHPLELLRFNPAEESGAPLAAVVDTFDAITNNPGAAGGAVTTRNGELIGLIGKELRNSLTETWSDVIQP